MLTFFQFISLMEKSNTRQVQHTKKHKTNIITKIYVVNKPCSCNNSAPLYSLYY